MAFIQYLILMGSPSHCRTPTKSRWMMWRRIPVVKQRPGRCRGMLRLGVVSFSVSAKWLQILTEFKRKEKISVGYFDTETLAVKTVEMYVEGFKVSLLKDTSWKGLWTVSFTLKEL